MKSYKLILLSVFSLFLGACGNKHSFNLNDYVDNDIEDLEYSISGNQVRVPFKQTGGVKTVQCLINGTIITDMVLDSGCSTTLISIDEAKYMFAKGNLTKNDYLGSSQTKIADGSIVENMVFNLKSLVIADKIECSNVEVTVSASANAPLLLGNEILDRMPKYTVDNEHQEIVFTLQ